MTVKRGLAQMLKGRRHHGRRYRSTRVSPRKRARWPSWLWTRAGRYPRPAAANHMSDGLIKGSWPPSASRSWLKCVSAISSGAQIRRGAGRLTSSTERGLTRPTSSINKRSVQYPVCLWLPQPGRNAAACAAMDSHQRRGGHGRRGGGRAPCRTVLGDIVASDHAEEELMTFAGDRRAPMSW